MEDPLESNERKSNKEDSYQPASPDRFNLLDIERGVLANGIRNGHEA